MRGARKYDPAQAVPDDKVLVCQSETPCYEDHYLGKCGCNCEDCEKCDCDCVLLARLDRVGSDPEHPEWKADHRVRRFIRPMLMRDPQVENERKQREDEEWKKRCEGEPAEYTEPPPSSETQQTPAEGYDPGAQPGNGRTSQPKGTRKGGTPTTYKS
ncbi:MAG: hypothetical protein U1E63_15950 [Burkholderiales bacterium]